MKLSITLIMLLMCCAVGVMAGPTKTSELLHDCHTQEQMHRYQTDSSVSSESYDRLFAAEEIGALGISPA